MTIDNELRHELLDMASDPVVAKAVRDDLRRLSNSESAEMAEMARELLRGRISLRAVGQSSAYAGPLSEGVAAFNRHLAGMTPEERTQFFEDAKRTLQRQRAEDTDQRGHTSDETA